MESIRRATIDSTISIDTNALGGERDIHGLHEGTDYSITVALLVSHVITDRNTVIHATDEVGKSAYNLLQQCLVCSLTAPSAAPTDVTVTSVTASNTTIE